MLCCQAPLIWGTKVTAQRWGACPRDANSGTVSGWRVVGKRLGFELVEVSLIWLVNSPSESIHCLILLPKLVPPPGHLFGGLHASGLLGHTLPGHGILSSEACGARVYPKQHTEASWTGVVQLRDRRQPSLLFAIFAAETQQRSDPAKPFLNT